MDQGSADSAVAGNMSAWKAYVVSVAISLTAAACVMVPMGPSVLVLPGNGKDFEQFKGDDAVCRRWAAQQVRVSTTEASTESAASGAAVGAVVGAGAGAAVGEAAGSPATGAAVGSGVGLLGGSAVGADCAAQAERLARQYYDMAYMQCMYAMGNQIPIPTGSEPMYGRQPSGPPEAEDAPAGIPAPPPGSPPPPPPGPSR